MLLKEKWKYEIVSEVELYFVIFSPSLSLLSSLCSRFTLSGSIFLGFWSSDSISCFTVFLPHVVMNLKKGKSQKGEGEKKARLNLRRVSYRRVTRSEKKVILYLHGQIIKCVWLGVLTRRWSARREIALRCVCVLFLPGTQEQRDAICDRATWTRERERERNIKKKQKLELILTPIGQWLWLSHIRVSAQRPDPPRPLVHSAARHYWWDERDLTWR